MVSAAADPGATSAAPPPASTRVEGLCEGIIEAGWLLALAVVPLFFNPYSERSYEPDKVAVLRSIVLVMLAAWLWKILSGGRASAWSRRPAARSRSARATWRQVGRAIGRRPLIPLALLIGASAVISGLFSIDPRLSWLGSYGRAQGVWTQLGYLTIFLLTLSHLSTRRQWRRMAYTMVVASLPVALYAVVQALGADPVPRALAGQRAYSTLGNPIFLGAYLSMVVFVTAMELYRSLAPRLGGGGSAAAGDRWRAPTLGLILICQLGALVLTQSRGPFLGLLAAGYVFCLVGLQLLRRWSAGTDPPSAGLRTGLRRAWLGVIVAGVFGLSFLAIFSAPESPLAPLRKVPYLGRLGSVLDFESNTAQVRLLIWRGALERLSSNRPFTVADGSPDPLHRARRWIGFGPETFSLAFNRFHPPELAWRESRGQVVDRAHNETFDKLIMTGVAGSLLWTAFFCAVFSVALQRLGLVRTRAQVAACWLVLSSGAILGAVVTAVVSGEAALFGVGLPTGLILGLVLFVTASSFLEGEAAERRQRPVHDQALALVILATVIAHMVEIHFGIGVVVTRLYFWLFAAALVAVAHRGLGGESPAPPRQATRRSGRAEPSSLRDGLLAGFVVAAICAPLVYGLTIHTMRQESGVAVLREALFGSASKEAALGRWPLFWLLLATIVGAAALLTTRKSLLSGLALGGLAPLAGYAVLHAGRVARTASLGAARAGLVETVEHLAGHFVTFAALLLALVLATGVVLGVRSGDRRPWSHVPAALSLPLGLLLALATGWLVQRANLRPIAADSFLKQARLLVEGSPERAIRLLEHASLLNPSEPMNYVYLGQAAATTAHRADSATQRARFMDRASDALHRARELAPHDPDHTVNLARFYFERGDLTEDGDLRESHYRRADAEFGAALALRPSAPEVIYDHARLRAKVGDLGAAESMLERAAKLDPESIATRLDLGNLHRMRAFRARAAGDSAGLLTSVRAAVAEFEKALLIDPENETAQRALAGLVPLLGRIEVEAPSRERLQTLYGRRTDVHLELAARYLESGRLDRALRHARLGFELASGEEREAAAKLLQKVLAALPPAE
jgi:tetratricopeptide (TPR) repeat protein